MGRISALSIRAVLVGACLALTLTGCDPESVFKLPGSIMGVDVRCKKSNSMNADFSCRIIPPDR